MRPPTRAPARNAVRSRLEAPPAAWQRRGITDGKERRDDGTCGEDGVVDGGGGGDGRATAEAFEREGCGSSRPTSTLRASPASRVSCASSTARRPRRSRRWRARSAPSTCSSTAPASSSRDRPRHLGTDWDFSFDLNVKSMHRLIRAFLPSMLTKGKGSIVNIASAPPPARGIPNRYVYGASKSRWASPRRWRRTTSQGDTLQRHLPEHDRAPSARRGGSRRSAPRAANRRGSARPSSTASRWAGSASPRKSPRSPSTSPPTRRLRHRPGVHRRRRLCDVRADRTSTPEAGANGKARAGRALPFTPSAACNS